MMSSKDLCTIENLSKMIDVIDGFKIEGRSKSEMYVGAVTKAYHHIIDTITNKTPIDEETKNLVYQIPHRPYRNGFLFNNIRSAPDGEEILTEDDYTINQKGGSSDDITNQGISKTTPGPIAEIEYVGLIHPESKKIEGKIFHLFTPKQKIYLGDTIQYFDENQIGSLKIT